MSAVDAFASTSSTASGGFTPADPLASAGPSEDLWLATGPADLTADQLARELVAREAVSEDAIARLLGTERHSIDVAQLEHALLSNNLCSDEVVLAAKVVLTGLDKMPATAQPTNRIPEQVARATGAVMLDEPTPTVAIVDPSEANRQTIKVALDGTDVRTTLVTVPQMRRLLASAYRAGTADDPRPVVTNLYELFDEMLTRRADELFVHVGRPPSMRVQGKILYLSRHAIADSWLREQLTAVGAERNGITFDSGSDRMQAQGVYAYGPERLWMAIGEDSSGVTVRVRALPRNLRRPEELGLPRSATELVDAASGLLLISGPARSGRSWAALSLIQHTARERARHIVTVEEPIVSLIDHGKSVLAQRQVPDHVASHEDGAHRAIQEGAEVLLIDEIASAASARAAVEAAQAGMLVVGVVSGVGTLAAFERVVHLAGMTGERERSDLARLMTGGVSLRMCQRASDGAQLIAAEVAVRSPDLEAALAAGDRTQMRAALESSAKSLGARTMEMSLAAYVSRQVITDEAASKLSSDPDRLAAWISKLSA